MRSVVICPECGREYSFDTLTCPICKRPTITVLRKPGEPLPIDTTVPKHTTAPGIQTPDEAAKDITFPIRSQQPPDALLVKEYSFHSTITLSKVFIILQGLLILVLSLVLGGTLIHIFTGGNSFAEIEEMIKTLKEPHNFISEIPPLLLLSIPSILFLFWVYYSNANLWALRIRDIEFSPGWAVGYFFVPFFNIVKPISIVKEIWELTYTGTAEDEPAYLKRGDLLVGLWWCTYILANISNQPFTMPDYDYKIPSAASIKWYFVCFILFCLLSITSWILSIVIVRTISRKQQEMKGLA